MLLFYFLMAKVGNKKTHAKKKQTFLRDLLRHEATDAPNNDGRPLF